MGIIGLLIALVLAAIIASWLLRCLLFIVGLGFLHAAYQQLFKGQFLDILNNNPVHFIDIGVWIFIGLIFLFAAFYDGKEADK